MSKVKEKNCRLCLKILDDDYDVIEEFTRGIFKILLFKVDLSVSEEPVLCKMCMEILQEAYDFKFTCISVDQQAVSLAMDNNSVELDIRDVYLKENENKSLAFNDDYNICRFCLQCQERSNFDNLNDLRKDLTDEMVLKCIPELDLNIIKEPVACAACMKSLNRYYCLAMRCHNTEENIMKYFQVQREECRGQINLNDVLKFMSEGMLNCSEITTLRGDKNVFQNEANRSSTINNVVLKIKEEEIMIKDENTCKDRKTEANICGETKQKEAIQYDMATDNDFSDEHMIIYKDKLKVTVYKCILCSYKSKWRNHLRNHMLTHKNLSEKHMLVYKDKAEVTVYKCTLCGHKSKWRNHLRNHMLTHKDSSDIVMYKCEKCNFQTKYKTYIKTHMVVHKDNSEVNMYKCNLCSYESKWKHKLTSHNLKIHKDSSDVAMFICEKCTFKTKYKESLKRHMIIHKDNSEVIMYRCNLCSYESKWKNKLTSHNMIIHKDTSDVAMHRCTKCTFETKYKYNLRTHMHIHKDNSEVI